MAKLISFVCLFILLIRGITFAEEGEGAISNRKTILILSSTGGGGHIAASNTLQKLVGEEYDLKVVYPINQLRIYGVPSCEQVYNTMLRKGWIRSVNFIVRNFVPSIFRSRRGKVEKIITSYIDSYKPDLVISLIPFINFPASEAARKNEIPFLLVTTDNDLRNWAFEMEKVRHPQMKVTIGADMPTTRDVLLKKNISQEAIETIGLPLRPDFMCQKDEKKIYDELDLPSNKEMILIMMGGAGGTAAYEYAKTIGNMNLGAHIVVVAGRNNKLKKELQQLKLHPSNTLTAFGFTDRVADLMAVADVIVTKPGPGTINEAIAMKLPILIDNTDTSLFWERANVDIVLKYGLGQKIKKFSQLQTLLMSYLQDGKAKQDIEKSFIEAPVNQFHLRIQGIIHELLVLREQTISAKSTACRHEEGLHNPVFNCDQLYHGQQL